jgi:hypothetical protein
MKIGSIAVGVVLMASRLSAGPPSPIPAIPKAEACRTMELRCNEVTFGELTFGGDCRRTTGSYYDSYYLDGSPGQVVGLTVRPLASTYKNPTLFADSAHGMASSPLSVAGAAGTIWYKPDAAGLWFAEVGSADELAAGPYLLETRCINDFSPGQCFSQEILCGQLQGWTITAESCSFSNVDRRFGAHRIYGVAGDTLTIEMVSSVFEPFFGVYTAQRGSSLQRSTTAEPGHAVMIFNVPTTGFYDILATATEDRSFGRYFLTLNCGGSGCLAPLITKQPMPMQVAYGERATLTVETNHIGPIEYQWYEFTDFPQLLATTSIPEWQPPPATSAHFYYVVASSPCGSDQSDGIEVGVKPSRRRSARH